MYGVMREAVGIQSIHIPNLLCSPGPGSNPLSQLPLSCPVFSHLGMVPCKESILEQLSYWSPSLLMESSLHGKVACTCRSVAINDEMK